MGINAEYMGTLTLAGVLEHFHFTKMFLLSRLRPVTRTVGLRKYCDHHTSNVTAKTIQNADPNSAKALRYKLPGWRLDLKHWLSEEKAWNYRGWDVAHPRWVNGVTNFFMTFG